LCVPFTTIICFLRVLGKRIVGLSSDASKFSLEPFATEVCLLRMLGKRNSLFDLSLCCFY
jgi:hypothetical protein